MIGIIDYGAGNTRSVELAFEKTGRKTRIIKEPGVASECSALILPGVGSFRSAMNNLKEKKWDIAIKSHIEEGKKLLGICLGMQVLFEEGCEDGKTQGLGLLKGKVEKIPLLPGMRVPHVGWNSVNWQSDHEVNVGIKSGIDFYHVHSYHCIPKSEQNIVATTDYGRAIVTAVAGENIFAVQFHPEKSQPTGIKLLKNFTKWAEI